jgi:hypothetical protein
MIYNEKVLNYKVVDYIQFYNFYFGRFSIWGRLYDSR